MRRRTATLVVCAIDTAVWLAVVIATVMSRSDAATIGLDRAAGILVTGLYIVTAAPAIALTVLRRLPTVALALAIAFPAAFAVAFVAAVVAFS
jgi:hypothetical protein